MKSVIKFREIFIGITGIDPIARAFTLASIAMETFKAKFYNPFRAPLGVTPKTYDLSRHRRSIIGDSWIDWCEAHKSYGKFTREQRIGTRFVDGAVLLTKTAFEFNGCIFHGCPKCYPDPSTPAPRHPGKTTGELYQEWREKEKYLVSLGFTVESKWGCELREERRTDRELDDFIKSGMDYYYRLNEVGIINPRDALFGGRTNNIKFHLRVDGVNSEIKYVDFTSLYPYEVSKRSYPIGQHG